MEIFRLKPHLNNLSFVSCSSRLRQLCLFLLQSFKLLRYTSNSGTSARFLLGAIINQNQFLPFMIFKFAFKAAHAWIAKIFTADWAVDRMISISCFTWEYHFTRSCGGNIPQDLLFMNDKINCNACFCKDSIYSSTVKCHSWSTPMVYLLAHTLNSIRDNKNVPSRPINFAAGFFHSLHKWVSY